VVNSKDLGIPVRMSTRAGLRRSEHNITTCAGVYHVTIMAYIIGSVIHRKLFRCKNGVVDDSNRVPFLVSEVAGVITIQPFPQETAEEVNAKLGDKILGD